MLRNEVISYKPDLVIMLLIHNDFNESFQFKPGVYTSSFLKLKIDNNAVIEEIQPEPYVAPWYNFLRKTATWRYLAYRQKVKFQVLKDIILGDIITGKAFADIKNDESEYQANIEVSNINEHIPEIKIATDYLFREIKSVCDKNNIEILILMDGNRDGIYNNIGTGHSYETGPLKLNSIAGSMALKYDINFIDMHPIFENDYSINHKSFTFLNDGHWNSYAHKYVADVIYKYIAQHSIY